MRKEYEEQFNIKIDDSVKGNNKPVKESYDVFKRKHEEMEEENEEDWTYNNPNEKDIFDVRKTDVRTKDVRTSKRKCQEPSSSDNIDHTSEIGDQGFQKVHNDWGDKRNDTVKYLDQEATRKLNPDEEKKL